MLCLYAVCTHQSSFQTDSYGIDKNAKRIKFHWYNNNKGGSFLLIEPILYVKQMKIVEKLNPKNGRKAESKYWKGVFIK